MGIPIPLLTMGTRVKVKRGPFPLDAGLTGREGRVTDASEYRPHRYGVTLDGDGEARYFRPEELEVIEAPALQQADREDAKRRRALP